MFETLADLAVNRHLPAEAEKKLVSFRRKEFSPNLEFVSASRTFGNRFDPVYEQGYAVICKPAGETFEISVLFPPGENDRVDALSPGDPFETKVTLLDFDTLYQRAVFGQTIEDSVEIEQEEEPPAAPKVEEEENEEQETLEKPQEEILAPISVEVPPEADPPVEAPAHQPAPKENVREQIPVPTPPPPAPPRPRPEGRPRRFAKPKKTKLFQLKETISNKIKSLRPKPCPNGHGPFDPLP
ncbi:MAG: hypothetical protein VB980_03255 [Opitutales bacterium]